uniref:SynN domain-containing protein n=1 Tax=Strongyloides papillosus TaxID=174720 RepID=A0A0N5BAU5_STREA
MSTPARKEGAKRGTKRNARSTSVTTNRSTDLSLESLCTNTSPIKRARVQEEYELGELNNRVADCIDIVKRLENDKSQLKIKVQEIETTINTAFHKISAQLEKGLQDVMNRIERSEARFNERTSQLDDLKSKAEYGELATSLQAVKLKALEEEIENLKKKYEDKPVERVDPIREEQENCQIM